MIGELPTNLEVNGRKLPILSTDYRNALLIFQAFNDPDLKSNEKQYIMIDALLGIENLNR